MSDPIHDVMITAAKQEEMARDIRAQMIERNGSEEDIPALPVITQALHMALFDLCEDMMDHPCNKREEAHLAIEDRFQYWLRIGQRKAERLARPIQRDPLDEALNMGDGVYRP